MGAEAMRSGIAPGGPGGAGTIRSATCRRPVLADTVVARRRPVATLLDAAPGSLVVISAPAGYGKTITAAQWDIADPRPFAWVSLGPLDDDPAHLVAHIATALADQSLLDTEDLRFLSGPGRSPQIDLVPTLLEILDHSDPFVLVVDDVHLLHDEQALHTLAAVVDGEPTNGVVALLSRSTPSIGLARRRLQGNVVEVGTTDLALTFEEGRDVFAGLGITVGDRQLLGIVERCEGWAGGVHLSALALRDRMDRAGGADAAPVTGRSRFMADYLVDEVLGGLDESTTVFLEEASVLGSMSAALLDAVLGRTESGQRLAALEASGNLFLVALDDEREWYRFHHLFGELLVARLRQRDPERFQALHRRASECFAADHDVDRALHHALAADDLARAAALVQQDAIALMFVGRVGTLDRRLALLPIEAWLTTADGAIAVAWQATHGPDEQLIRHAVQAALAADDGSPLADGTPSVAVGVALLHALLSDGGFDGILANTAVVLEAGPPDLNPWWGMAMCLRATALFQLGRPEEARAGFHASIPRLQRTPGVAAASLMYLGLLHLRDGDLAGALGHVDRGRAIADRHQLSGLVPLLVVYTVDSLVCARAGRTQRALESVAFATESLGRLGATSPRTGVFGHLVLAEAHHALQDGAEARRHAAEARRLLRDHPLSAELARQLATVDDLLAAGPSGSDLTITPLTTAERRVLPLLATHLSLPQVATELNVSRNTVKTHCVAVYRKLGVTSRAGAVAEARRLGLIDR